MRAALSIRVALSTTSRMPSPSSVRVVHGGVVVARHELVQPDPLDETRAWVHQGDVDVAAHPQMVGRQRSGVAAADDDDLGMSVVCLCSHALKTPPTART